MSSYNYVFKYIIVGAMGVGKSSLLTRFIEDKFYPEISHTIGVEFATKIIEIVKERVKLQVWDTAGQERFRAVTRSYYRGTSTVFLVYDISRRSSFNQLETWLNDAKNYTDPNVVKFLIGNKIDINERQVSYEEGQDFAKENNLQFIETSAKSGENVEDAFIRSANLVYKLVKEGKLTKNVVVNPKKISKKNMESNEKYRSMEQESKSGCC
ncbi:rab2a [Anaeramoeba flamelloides]|uniref:Rab2a n=1 Tax=Anaeramoeba flamelloides TaxID=1746091 RepID=A0AAV7YNL7_9EUKA|nr:rab2a member ras oncogene family [Anaeramoeba flamelloides]KAJ3431313.1 rab2a member ras oncogene family [Anaeramoeba flamelloides]KAJ6230504.1 rab2a [Anaeramoeba flamelloides]KAJ6230533.1 rab2a [Anaeramoeba flamelloides]